MAASFDIEKDETKHLLEEEKRRYSSADTDEQRLSPPNPWSLSACVLLLAGLILFFSASSILWHMSATVESSKFWISSVNHPLQIDSQWGAIALPYPTGAYWTNIVHSIGLNSYVVGAYPYQYKFEDHFLSVSYGSYYRHVEAKSVVDGFVADLMVGLCIDSKCTGFQDLNKHVVSYDNVSVQVQLEGLSSTNCVLVPVVKGSPYVSLLLPESNDRATKKCTLAPIRLDTIHQFVEVKSVPTTENEQWFLRVRLSNNQLWMISGKRMNISVEELSPNSLILRPTDCSGIATDPAVIRLAAVPLVNAESSLKLLMDHADTIPIGGDLHIDEHQSQNASEVTLRFQYRTKGGNTENLFMLALPHHLPLMRPKPVNNQKTPFLMYSIKGPMVPVFGSTWLLHYPYLNVGIYFIWYLISHMVFAGVHVFHPRDE